MKALLISAAIGAMALSLATAAAVTEVGLTPLHIHEIATSDNRT